jgi:hypothetical protein
MSIKDSKNLENRCQYQLRHYSLNQLDIDEDHERSPDGWSQNCDSDPQPSKNIKDKARLNPV